MWKKKEKKHNITIKIIINISALLLANNNKKKLSKLSKAREKNRCRRLAALNEKFNENNILKV